MTSSNFYNRIYVNTLTTGTGNVTPGSAVDGYRNFSNVSEGFVSYTISDGTNFETGQGTWNGTTLERTSIYESSNSGGPINLSGSAQLFLDYLAQDIAVAANPSTNIGLTIVNGTANTFMRSDAAPALDQTISPTWSGKHTFQPSNTSNILTILGANGVGSSINFADDNGNENSLTLFGGSQLAVTGTFRCSSLSINGANPKISFFDDNSNQFFDTNWSWDGTIETFSWQFTNFGTNPHWMDIKINANTATIVSVTFPNSPLILGTSGSVQGQLQLCGNTSGNVTILAPASPNNYTITLPSDPGSSGQILTTDNAGNLSFTNPINLGSIGWLSANSGTGNLYINSALTGYVTPDTIPWSGNAYYRAQTSNGSQWEVGQGIVIPGNYIWFCANDSLHVSNGTNVPFSSGWNWSINLPANTPGTFVAILMQTTAGSISVNPILSFITPTGWTLAHSEFTTNSSTNTQGMVSMYRLFDGTESSILNVSFTNTAAIGTANTLSLSYVVTQIGLMGGNEELIEIVVANNVSSIDNGSTGTIIPAIASMPPVDNKFVLWQWHASGGGNFTNTVLYPLLSVSNGTSNNSLNGMVTAYQVLGRDWTYQNPQFISNINNFRYGLAGYVLMPTPNVSSYYLQRSNTIVGSSGVANVVNFTQPPEIVIFDPSLEGQPANTTYTQPVTFYNQVAFTAPVGTSTSASLASAPLPANTGAQILLGGMGFSTNGLITQQIGQIGFSYQGGWRNLFCDTSGVLNWNGPFTTVNYLQGSDVRIGATVQFGTSGNTILLQYAGSSNQVGNTILFMPSGAPLVNGQLLIVSNVSGSNGYITYANSTNVPIADPHVAGSLWVNTATGALMMSQG